MRFARVDSVGVAWSSEGLTLDPLEDLFTQLEAPPIEQPTLRIALRAAPPRANDPREDSWEPWFFHGIVQAYRRSGEMLFWDRSSRLVATSDGMITGEIAAEDEVEPGSTGALLEIAIAFGLRTCGLYHLHAAALIHPPSATAAIVVGGSGAGKTTTTIALLEAGWRYLGDDALFLCPGAIVALHRNFHLGAATLEAIPKLAPHAGRPTPRTSKRPVDPRAAYPERRDLRLPLAAARVLCFFPTVTAEATTTIAPIPKADALGGFLASSASLVVGGLPGLDDNLTALRDLVDRSQSFELRLGADAVRPPIETFGTRLTAVVVTGF